MSETEKPVAEAVRDLVSAVDAIGSSPEPDPCQLVAAQESLEALRARYKVYPDEFGAHVEALRRASKLLAEIEERTMMAAAKAFVDADRAMRREEARREACRTLLVRAAERKGINRWDVGELEVAAQQHLSLEVPESGTERRVALERFLVERGLWREVSALNRSILIKALESGRVAGDDRAQVERWCSPGTSWRLVVRPPREGATPE